MIQIFLGGRDLEMATIAELARSALSPERVHDARLAWGARASAYGAEIAAALAAGERAVLVELQDDLPAALERRNLVLVDHHGARAGADVPSSLAQVFALLGCDPSHWTRWHALVAVNDVAHVRGLGAMGATPDEIRQVRDADRAAQGVTPADEAAARQAIASAERRGALTVVRTASARTSPVADFLEPAYGGPGAANLLVLSPGEANVFGSGALVQDLAGLPGSWYGGALPERGFWGIRLGAPEEGETLAGRIEAFLRTPEAGEPEAGTDPDG